MPKAVSVFVLPPDMNELENRLRKRATEDEGKINRRLKVAAGEIAFAEQYDYQIVNDYLDDAYCKLRAVYLDNAGFMKHL